MNRKKRHSGKYATAWILATMLGLLAPGTLTEGQQDQSSEQPPGLTQDIYVLKSQTNVVLVDVRVRDKTGNPVTDLTQQNFHVWEDKVPQTISSFSLEDVQKLAQAEAESGPPAIIDLAKLPRNVPPETVLQGRRMSVLFFDVTSMQSEDLIRALEAAQRYVEKRLTPADLVAVVSYTSNLRILQDFTNDRDVLAKAIKSIIVGEESSSLAVAGTTGEAGGTIAFGEEIVTRDVSAAFTPDETEFSIFNTDQKLAAIESLCRMLRALPGRKSVIHFSSGIERTGSENQAQLRGTVDAANQSNVSIYSMDTRGLMALPPGGDASAASPSGTGIYTGSAISSQFSSLHGSRETLASLSQDTGGRTFYDLNNLDEAFERIQAENSSYYLLGYTPKDTRSDGKFRRIRVEVDRPGVKIEGRPGYFAPKDFRLFTREDKERQLEQAMELEEPFLSLPFVVDTAYFRTKDQNYQVVLAAKIPGSALSFLQKSGKHETEFDFVWRVTDAQNKIAGVLRDTLPVKVEGEAYEQLQRGNILYQGEITLAPGTYHLKTVLRENLSGKLGTFELTLVLPELAPEGLFLSTVVLSNEVRNTSDSNGSSDRRRKQAKAGLLAAGGREILPSVTRVFRSDQTLAVYLESYGVKTEPGEIVEAARPSASPSMALLFFRGGRKVAEAGPFEGTTQKGERLKTIYFAEVPLAKIPAGRYTLQSVVVDPAENRVAFARTPMAIVGSLPRPGAPPTGE